MESVFGIFASIVDLPAGGTPGHDTFIRLFRLLDPEQTGAALPFRDVHA